MEEREDNYDEQIEALLLDDYETFAELIGAPIQAAEHNNHHSAWGLTGGYEKSLFSFLPDDFLKTAYEYECSMCATQVDLPENMAIGDKLFGEDRTILSPLSTRPNKGFDRGELRLIANRQRIARGFEPVAYV